MGEVLGRVLDHWRRAGVPLLPPPALSAVTSVWQRLGRTLTADVEALYAAVGGFSGAAMDDRYWTLWPLDRVADENAARPSSGVRFSDFMIDSHYYEFRAVGPDQSAVWLADDGAGFEVAAGVAEFLTRYLDDPEGVFLIWASESQG